MVSMECGPKTLLEISLLEIYVVQLVIENTFQHSNLKTMGGNPDGITKYIKNTHRCKIVNALGMIVSYTLRFDNGCIQRYICHQYF